MSERLNEDLSGKARRVTVIGAGFSGLVSAYALVRAGFKVDVVELSNRTGGLIQTHRTEHGLVETAANALLNSANVEELFREVGVPLLGTEAEARKRFIFRRGRARRWPLGFADSFRVLWFGLRYIIARASVAPRALESARDWSSRVMGAEAGRSLIEAALQGIYAGDPAKMSASLIFRRMFSSGPPRARKPSVRGSVAPPNGMGQLIEAIEIYLKNAGVEFRFGSSVDFEEAPTHPHVLALPADQAASVLRGLSPERSQILKHIEFAPVVTTTAFFDGTDAKTQGFGILFPPAEGRRVLGVLKNNFIFKNRAERLFSETWIAGGALASPHIIDEKEEEILARVLSERELISGKIDRLIASQITRWRRGIPQYTVTLEKEIDSLQGFERNVILMSNYLGDIGLAKLLDRALLLPAQVSQNGVWV